MKGSTGFPICNAAITIDEGNNLLKTLRRFNAKERFHLLSHFLGEGFFSKPFIDNLAYEIMVPPEIFSTANDTFCAMDYHLDWLNAALELFFLGRQGGSRLDNDGKEYGRKYGRITGYQDDIDLLLAFDTKSPLARYHIVLIEAKGATNCFSQEQLKPKLIRLKNIFLENDKLRFQDVKVYLVLMGPNCPKWLLEIESDENLYPYSFIKWKLHKDLMTSCPPSTTDWVIKPRK